MPTVIQPLTKEEAKTYLDQFSVTNRVPQNIIEILKKEGWKIDEYCATKRYKKYFIYIEFCIGDYCVYPGSKNNGWVLEKKQSCPDFITAFATATILQQRIDAGEHWIGEED